MFLGIDLGTSEVKVLQLNDAGGVVSSAGAPLEISHPQALWSKQDPADWWRATESAIAHLRAVERSEILQQRFLNYRRIYRQISVG